MKKIDLTGRKFHRLTVLSQGNHIGKYVRWLCKCDCGEQLEVIAAHLANGNTKSCGCLQREKVSQLMFKDLRGLTFGKLKVLEKIANNTISKKIRYRCICDCGNETDVIGADLKSGKTTSCGCIWRARITTTGENHFSWNSNLTSQDREGNRSIPGYIEWRKAVYERDNFTCKKCNQSISGSLNAHHIENYSSSPELRTSIDNGITLCEGCHMDFHHIYGYKENNMEQLRNFLVCTGDI